MTAELSTIPDPCIGTGRGIKGNVYDSRGRVIGRVFKQSRRLRDSGGRFGEAWTANIVLPDGCEAGCSLGTRHPDRWHAARAIRAFWETYPPERIAQMIDGRVLAIAGRARHTAEAREAGYRIAAGRAAALFKYDHYETCGLTARYRGADPRSYMRELSAAA